MTAHTERVLSPGVLIDHERQRHVVVQVLDGETVLLRNLLSGGVTRVTASDLNPQQPFTQLNDRPLDLMAVGADPWTVARTRHEMIEPLLSLQGAKRTLAQVKVQAQLAGVHPATIYRWLDAYEASHTIDVLLPRARKDKGSYKLGEAVETIVQETIDELYLTPQKRGVQGIVTAIRNKCRDQEIELPHYNTVRKRIKERNTYLVAAKRLGEKRANDLYGPNTKPFPGPQYPMSMVQMDHVKLDLEMVDDLEGLPVGRAWLTLMICVRTRMIPGFWLSLEEPNAFAVGMCVANAVLPKHELLAKHKVDATWPIQGFPRVIHTDNAREFHGEALERACAQYGLTQEYRPRGRPNFGGHIERLAKTFNNMLEEELGTTFNSHVKRGETDPAAHAVYTLTRLEEWMVRAIKLYHLSFHSGLSTTPMQRFLDDVRGSDDRPGTGLRVADVDPHRLRLDFMPFFERAIQNYGVQFELIQYYHNVLRNRIDERDPANPKRARKFLFRYDPRNMRQIYFFDPELREYFPIPYRDTSFPVLSQWETKAAKRHRKRQGLAAVDQDAVRQSHEELQQTRDIAKKETKSRRRAAQKKRASEPVVPDSYFEKVLPVTLPDSSDDRTVPLFVAGFEEVDF